MQDHVDTFNATGKEHRLAVWTAVLGIALLTFACKTTDSGNTGTTPTGIPADKSSTSDERAPATADADRQSWIAAWTSPACGARKYTRNVSFAADGSITGEERVSPCPKGVTCVWSGIIRITGSYTLEGRVAKLELRPTGQAPKAPSLPTELVWDADAGAPVEVQGDTRCVYKPAGQ